MTVIAPTSDDSARTLHDHTITMCGADARHARFVVSAEGLWQARQIMVILPAYRRWYDKQRALASEPFPKAVRSPLARCHLGEPTCLDFIDLRPEQHTRRAVLEAARQDEEASEGDLAAVLRDELRDWCGMRCIPMPTLFHLHAERDDSGALRLRRKRDENGALLRPARIELRYPDGAHLPYDKGFGWHPVRDVLNEIDNDSPVDELIVRLLPEAASVAD